MASDNHIDGALEVLSNEIRRELIVELLETPSHQQPIDAVSVVQRQVDGKPKMGSDGGQKVSLHHTHLPMMTDCEFIDVVEPPFGIEQGPAFDVVGDMISTLSESESVDYTY